LIAQLVHIGTSFASFEPSAFQFSNLSRKVKLMRLQVLGCAVVTSGLIFAGMAPAQTEKRIEVQKRVVPADRASADFPRASSIIGAKATIQDNVSIGKVDDLVLDHNGRVEYLVVNNEGKYVLVPWGAAKLDADQRTVMVEIKQDKFREVPTFTRESWPNFSDAQYIERINTYYGVRPGRERRIERREDRRDR
jgi:PRC-barrel domain protein